MYSRGQPVHPQPKPDNIPQLYVYAQLFLAVNKTTIDMAPRHAPQAVEQVAREELLDLDIQGIMNAKLSDDDYRVIVDELAFGRYACGPGRAGPASPDQDRALVGLCRPDRLLRMMRDFILFDGPHKVIARFQQVNAVKRTGPRARPRSEQRSGGHMAHARLRKSLTMVMLAALIGQSSLNNARIVLVTDRMTSTSRLKAHSKTPAWNRCAPIRAASWWILSETIKPVW